MANQRLSSENQNLIGGMVVGAVITWVVMMLTGWADAAGNEAWWNIAAAMGTMAAVVTAISFAVWDSVRRRKEGVARAKLVATALRPRLMLAKYWNEKIAKAQSIGAPAHADASINRWRAWCGSASPA